MSFQVGGQIAQVLEEPRAGLTLSSSVLRKTLSELIENARLCVSVAYT